MKGLDILKTEHDHIRIAVQKMKDTCGQILDGKEIDIRWFQNMILFCRNYADKHHHGKEEKILFRVMLEELGPVADKLIRNGMLVEHDLGRFHISELENALSAYEREPTTRNKLEIVTNASEYASLLNRHMDKEDTVVYVFAENQLNDELKDKANLELINFGNEKETETAMESLKWLQTI